MCAPLSLTNHHYISSHPSMLYPPYRYCNNGICRFNRLAAAYSNVKGCAAPSTAPCKENVIYNNEAGYTDARFGLTGYNMPDGAYCDTKLTKVCQGGSCNLASSSTSVTPSPTRTLVNKTCMISVLKCFSWSNLIFTFSSFLCKDLPKNPQDGQPQGQLQLRGQPQFQL